MFALSNTTEATGCVFLVVYESRKDRINDRIKAYRSPCSAISVALRKREKGNVVRRIEIGGLTDNKPRGRRERMKSALQNGKEITITFGDHPMNFSPFSYYRVSIQKIRIRGK